MARFSLLVLIFLLNHLFLHYERICGTIMSVVGFLLKLAILVYHSTSVLLSSVSVLGRIDLLVIVLSLVGKIGVAGSIFVPIWNTGFLSLKFHKSIIN